MSDIVSDIREFLSRELGRDVSRVGDTDSLLEAGVLDSIGVLALVSFIERRYGISVPEDEMMPDNFDTVEAVARFVDRMRQPGVRP